MKWSNKNAKLLIIILLIGLVTRIHYFVGLNWSDDVHYVHLANQAIEGKFIPSYMTSLRLAMIFPLAFFFKLFGYSQVSAVLYPLICSLGNIVLAYLIASLLINEKAGLISTLLISIYPLDVNYATWIMPDVPLSFFHALSLYLFLLAEREGSRNKMIIAGILSGFSLSFKVFWSINLGFLHFIHLYKNNI